jgi:hypothetical protein
MNTGLGLTGKNCQSEQQDWDRGCPVLAVPPLSQCEKEGRYRPPLYSRPSIQGIVWMPCKGPIVWTVHLHVQSPLSCRPLPCLSEREPKQGIVWMYSLPSRADPSLPSVRVHGSYRPLPSLAPRIGYTSTQGDPGSPCRPPGEGRAAGGLWIQGAHGRLPERGAWCGLGRSWCAREKRQPVLPGGGVRLLALRLGGGAVVARLGGSGRKGALVRMTVRDWREGAVLVRTTARQSRCVRLFSLSAA